ncbi:MAG: S-layer homology domain-containing protein, partial [Clostridiales Family XIII bacterium]|nr:S-layer homology domain-containing protein [Clostridiales Family XIII bacterium]
SAWSGNNANSAASVLWALSALGEDLNDWTVNGKTPLDALLSFQTAQGGFGVSDGSANDPMATRQAALALAQIKTGVTLANMTANGELHKSLSVGVVDASGDYHERSVTVNNTDTLSDALARALRTPATVDPNAYHSYANGASFGGNDLPALADGAKILAIHGNFENAAYFKTKADDGLGVNAIEIPFGGTATLQLVVASASAISATLFPADIDVDTDGDKQADGATDAEGKIALQFNAAGTYSVFALPGGALGGVTAVLPARVTVTSAENTTVVSVRVEGASEHILFDPAVPVGYSGANATVLDAILQALQKNQKPYAFDSYGMIASIAGEEGNPGAWLYTIAADEYLKSGGPLPSQPIADGDEIVVYRSNENYDTLFPLVDFTLNADKSLTLTVKAWPAWGGDAKLPVADVRVFWDEHVANRFTGLTDENGALVIPAANATAGSHTLRLSKTSASGLPDIVRLAPGYTVEVTETGASPQPPAAADRVYIKVTGPSGTLFARMGFPWYGGVTPLDLLSKTGLSYETDAAGAYVSSIGGVKEFDYGPNSGWLYRVNGVETIKESAAAYKLNAGDELEWFYTRDYTKEEGSGAWSGSAATADESAATAALRPEAEAKDGAVAIKLDDEDVRKVVSEALRDGAREIVIAPKITGEANKVSVELSAASARSIANDTTAGLALETALGDMHLSHAGLAALTKEGSGPLTLSVERNADLVSALVALNGKAVQSVEGGVRLRVPSADAESKPSAGTVAILVREDGSEEVILLSAVTTDGIIAVLNGSATIRTEDRSHTFDDVREGAWYKDDAAFVSARELFRGTGENAFSGDLPMTRAMLVAVFHRLAGSPAAEGNAFPDVSDAAWYREAAQWAAAEGIVLGTGEGFAGDREITREQIAAMAMRFAASVGADMGRPEELSGFTDGAAVSAWAEDAVQWAVGADLLKGDGSLLNPGGLATRAEVAAVMRRFIEHWAEGLR